MARRQGVGAPRPEIGFDRRKKVLGVVSYRPERFFSLFSWTIAVTREQTALRVYSEKT
jgi:hypothetical protein